MKPTMKPTMKLVTFNSSVSVSLRHNLSIGGAIIGADTHHNTISRGATRTDNFVAADDVIGVGAYFDI